MTDIRVNSVFPIASTDSAKSSRSNSDFLFSLQSVSASGAESKTSTESSRQSRKSASKVTLNEARSSEAVSTDSSSKANIAQKSSQSNIKTDSGKDQHTSAAANTDNVRSEQDGSNQQTSSVKELQNTIGNGAVQKSEKVGTELSELQNQTSKTDTFNTQTDVLQKRPMLDLNLILERLGSFAGNISQDALISNEITKDSTEGVEPTSAVALEGPEEAVLFKNGQNAPIIDLDRILEGLRSEAGLTETLENEEPIRIEQEQTVLPQINFDRILKSVEDMQEGEEVILSADRINAAEAEKSVKRDRVSDNEKIAANVGLVWDDLSTVLATASNKLAEGDLQIQVASKVTESSAAESIQKTTELLISESDNDELNALYERFAKALSETEKPSTLEQLKAKLATAMMMAVQEMNDPDKQAEEQEEKILEFLLKFLERMNEDDKESALDGKKGGDLGILLQIIENMIDDVRDGTQIADNEENVFEITSVAAAKSADTGYGVNNVTSINKSTSTNSGAGRTATENRIDTSVLGAAEGAYATADDVNENVVKALGVLSIPADQIETRHLSATAENQDEMIEKAEKVLSRPNRDGTIRETELPDEFAELKKLIDDMKKTHEDDEEKEQDDEENEPGHGGKGIKGDSKSDIIRAISIKSSEPGEAAVAKSFAEERSGAKQILSQIATEVLNNAPKEKRTVALVMTLTPENLGKVTLKITEQAGKLNVMVTAHNKETAEILASRMDGLQEALKDSGTQLEKYQVVYGPEENADARQQSYEGSSKNPYVRQVDEEGTDKDGDFSELLREAV